VTTLEDALRSCETGTLLTVRRLFDELETTEDFVQFPGRVKNLLRAVEDPSGGARALAVVVTLLVGHSTLPLMSFRHAVGDELFTRLGTGP
jgi:hypothetical protein